jgi:pimeloyl-ACP methyl ester carboxylesterase
MECPMTDRPTLLLVHGAWHGSWCWKPLQEVLEDRGWSVQTVDLPTVHSPEKAGLPLQADVDAVSGAIDRIDGDVVVVAHSYGGVPVSEAARPATVRHIVYVSAFVLDAGESLLAAVGGVAPPWWHVDGPLVTAGDDDAPPSQLFYGDVEPELAAASAARLTSQSVLAFTDVTTRAAWREIPSTYVITEDDGAIPVFAQEAMAARTASIERMKASHSPFLSAPEDLADIVAAAAS